MNASVPMSEPIAMLYDSVGPTQAPNLLLMLPGARDVAQDFVQHGFIAALRERACCCDVAALDAHMEYYLEQSIVEHLHSDIIAPALAQGRQAIWLLGISLGGMGCLRYARAYPQHIAGVILLAPFLATRGLIAEVTAAGGLDHWAEGDISGDSEREFLAWLKHQAFTELPYTQTFLGYGRADRFAPASALLALRLPAHHTLVGSGGHDWRTWKQLWTTWLDQQHPWHDAL